SECRSKGRLGVRILFEQDVGAKRYYLAVLNRTNQMKSDGIFALLTAGETGVNQQGRFVHKAMGIVLDAIHAAYWNSVTGNIFHPGNSRRPGDHFPGRSENRSIIKASDGFTCNHGTLVLDS